MKSNVELTRGCHATSVAFRVASERLANIETASIAGTLDRTVLAKAIDAVALAAECANARMSELIELECRLRAAEC